MTHPISFHALVGGSESVLSRRICLTVLSTGIVLGWPGLALAQQSDVDTDDFTLASVSPDDLSALSIEDLAQIPVQSASKRSEPLSAVPAAMYVISGEDITAAAANSLPEALRLAPNLQVQQVSAREYAISSRGFNSVEASNKLLVLIDGRTVYTPLHAGVFWDLHNPLLEDIHQIEVVSGPGGSLYGPNAVNGVIHVISRDARDTTGLLARGTAGARERTLAARYGAPLGAGAFRVYGNWFDREDLPGGVAADAPDQLRGWQAGFRADLPAGDDLFTIQGDVFANEAGTFADDGNRGQNLQLRWKRQIGDDSAVQIRAYYDEIQRDLILVRDSLETYDVEAQYTDSFGSHDLVVGVGLRTTKDEFINDLNAFKLDPVSRRLWVANVFAQDRIALAPGIGLVLGLKLENSTYTGFEFLPNIRLAWQLDDTNLVWAAISRAVRTPSRIDRELANLPILAKASGFRSEKLVAFEAGYRGRVIENLNVSANLFYNIYDDLRTTELSEGGTLPIRLSNGIEGSTYGIEAWGTAQPAPPLRLQLGVATLWKDFEVKPGHLDLAAMDSVGDDPEYHLKARALVDLTDRWKLNAGLRYTGAIDTAPRIASYLEADAQLTFRASASVELFVAGTNLLHDQHLESNDVGRGQAVERSIFAGSRLRF